MIDFKINTYNIEEQIEHVDLDELAAKIRKNLVVNLNDDKNYVDKNLENNEEELVFQIFNWNAYHEDDDSGSKVYTIRLFGRHKDTRTVCVTVRKYNPDFYVEIPDNWNSRMRDSLMNYVKKKVYPKENTEGLLAYEVIEKYKFWGFTNYKKFKFIKLTFKDVDSMRSYERVFKKPMTVYDISRTEFTLQLYESNIEPYLRCMHIRNLEAVGWVSINPQKYTVIKTSPTINDINVETHWTELNVVDERKIQPYVIASFDIECTSGDGQFPQAYREEDKIIQIGTVFTRFGENDNEPFYQHMITLGSCDPIPDVDVESYEDERDVLLAWTRMIQNINPDVITGYNILGFDLAYMKDRAKKLGIYERFAKLTRIRNEVAQWKEKKLESSALGKNMMNYFEFTGRVLIDLMKVIQREQKLDSYKLDFAASYFIKEKVNKMSISKEDYTTIIETKKTMGIKVGQFITINYTDGIAYNKHMDGKKFKIIALSKNTIIVAGIIDDSIFVSGGYDVFGVKSKMIFHQKTSLDYRKEVRKIVH